MIECTNGNGKSQDILLIHYRLINLMVLAIISNMAEHVDVLFENTLAAKIEGNNLIRMSGYPLLYAVLLDLGKYDGHLPVISSEIEPSEPIYDDRRGLIRRRLPSPIDLTDVTDATKFETESIYGGREGTTRHVYTATNEIDLAEIIKGHRQLVDAMNKACGEGSYTQRIVSALAEKHPSANKMYVLHSALRGIMEGILSVYETASFLSQSREPNTRITSRVVNILRSSAPLEMTIYAKLGMLAQVGSIGTIPSNEVTDQNGEFHMHEDVKTFFSGAEFLDMKPFYPLPCPFVAPLHEAGVEGAITYYGGEENLPAELVSFMRQHVNESGITTAGRVIADYLESRLTQN